MPNYEIMMILSPKQEEKFAKDFVERIFGKDIKKSEKMKNTDLAYPINKSKKAMYFLLTVSTDPKNIKEFVRLSNIAKKDVWRYLIINLDEEKTNKKLNKFNTPKPRVPRRSGERPERRVPRENREESKHE